LLEVHPQSGLAARVKVFAQIHSGEPGIVTAALLSAQYGDRYRLFIQTGSIYVPINSAALELIQDYLSHELIGQAA
jgi:hypothetical protein